MRATTTSEEHLPGVAYSPAIKELFDKTDKKGGDLTENFVFETFRSIVYWRSEFTCKWVNALGDDTLRRPLVNLNRMFIGEEPSYEVSTWFVNRHFDLAIFYGN